MRAYVCVRACMGACSCVSPFIRVRVDKSGVHEMLQVSNLVNSLDLNILQKLNN